MKVWRVPVDTSPEMGLELICNVLLISRRRLTSFPSSSHVRSRSIYNRLAPLPNRVAVILGGIYNRWPHAIHPFHAWQSDVDCVFIKFPPHPDISLHDPRPSPSSQMTTSSAPICTFRSRTVTPTQLTRISARNSILAGPLNTRSEVR